MERKLVKQLRSTVSVSKRKMLDAAANTIEKLLAEVAEFDAAVAELKELDVDCLVCDHNHRTAPCEGTDYLCDDCPFECPCKGCKNNSKWAWHGRC